MAKSKQKLEAIVLRRRGESVNAIAKKLSVSKSSACAWTRDVILTPSQQRVLNQRQIAGGHAGRVRGADMNRRKKQERIAFAETEAKERLSILSDKEIFAIGLGLYWGEGTKASDGTVAIVNSDPRIIEFMIRWFRECWGVDTARFQPRVFISDVHKDREQVITKFWVKRLKIPRNQFRRMIFLNKGKKIYENRDMYYGVLTLRIAKGSELRHRILASISQVAEIGIAPV